MKRTTRLHKSSRIYATQARMIDGTVIDVLLFWERRDAEQHAAYIRDHCKLLGFDSVNVVERHIIGKAPAVAAV